MELRHLKYFVVVAEELHFGRAAARLCMTQPPLSNQIQQLEEDIGVKLFNRTKRKVELTDAGKVFLQEIKKTLKQAEESVKAAQQVQKGDISTLSIGFESLSMYNMFPKIIREYRKKFPNISITLHELSSSEQVKRLQENHIDIGLLYSTSIGTNDELELEPIHHMPCTICLPKGHPLANKSRITINDLRDESFVFISRGVCPTLYDNFLSLCQNAGFSPQILQEVTGYQNLIGLVAAGIGITLLPMAIEQVYQSEVIYKKIYNVNFITGLAFAYKKNKPSEKVLNFMHLAINTLINNDKAKIIKREKALV